MLRAGGSFDWSYGLQVATILCGLQMYIVTPCNFQNEIKEIEESNPIEMAVIYFSIHLRITFYYRLIYFFLPKTS